LAESTAKSRNQHRPPTRLRGEYRDDAPPVRLNCVTLANEDKVRISAAILAGVGLNLPAAFAKMDDGKTT